MINYMKSEMYRIRHKKSLYITSIIGLALIAFAAAVLNFFVDVDPNFRYARTLFFYSNVISSNFLILIIALIFNVSLTGKDSSMMKQAVAFGISRNSIFWSKLIITLVSFILLCIIGLSFTIFLGETFLTVEDTSVKNFLIACSNMIPMVLSGFIIIHSLRMLKVGEVYIFIILLAIYSFSDSILRVIFRSISGLNELYKYSPSALLDDNLLKFMDLAAHVDIRSWITGGIISVIALFFGIKMFSKQNIDG